MTDGLSLQLREVVNRYGDSFTLEVPKLDVPPGEVLAIVGPTGSGKSTLLRLMSGLETPTAGEIRIGPQQLRADQLPLAQRRRMTMVFQHPLLLSGSVTQNLQYGITLRGRQFASRKKVDSLMTAFGLESIAEQSAQTLSGGQRQLVAVARALLIEPAILLLDEPTANLDPAAVALVEQVLAEDQQRSDTTVIWSTHNLFQARRVSTRTALLFNGELVEVAPTEQFFDSPADSRTADFVSGKTIY